MSQDKRSAISLGSALVMALTMVLAGTADAAEEGTQKVFKSPEEAAKALIAAAEANDAKTIASIFGPGSEEIIGQGDPVAEKNVRAEFAAAAKKALKVVKEGEKKAVFEIGENKWPFPIPVVKVGENWIFDTAEGKEELLNRRIGKNELETIATCLAYVKAQKEYASADRDGDKVLEYAQKIKSDEGKKNGLYWPVPEGSGEELSPLGPLAAQAQAKGYKPDQKVKGNRAYQGYLFKVLTRQGKNAPGGKYDYVINGNMIAGFALVAYPAKYGSSGVMTFLVNHQGKVYEKDLAEKTGKIGKDMKEYDPDESWKKADVSDEKK